MNRDKGKTTQKEKTINEQEERKDHYRTGRKKARLLNGVKGKTINEERERKEIDKQKERKDD